MTRSLIFTSLLALVLSRASAGFCTTFDERLWEKYAEIETSPLGVKVGLSGIYLEPHLLGDVTAKTPFADVRIMTDRKTEVPYQIVTLRPEQRKEELPAQIRNLSRTEAGDTWLELLIDRQDPQVSAVEIITPDTDFSRQVQILGSNDGKSWNILRKDGVIFDLTRGEKLRHTHISFPQTTFRHLALQIANAAAQPLNISEVKVLQESEEKGQSYSIYGVVEKSEGSPSSQENNVVVRMSTVFPIDRLVIQTPERNFQRSVEVHIKRGNGGWERWAEGTIFNFDAADMHESQLSIDIPEIATGEYRLVFKNLDSPPISVTGITGEGYRRLLVFRQQGDQKLYMFWGNPPAQQPQYDLASLVAKQKPSELPITNLGPIHSNTKFAGNSARLPFSERYKYPLYAVVTMVIAGLIFLQYRVFRSVGE